VIINGDMKHEFSRNKSQEWDEVETILDMLSHREVIIVRGNHDNYLQTILARRNIRMVDHITLPASRINFLHGHKMVDMKGMKIFSHEHPVLRFRDKVGAQISLPCFLYEEEKQILIMPAFSPLASGTNIISPEKTFMCPDLKDKDMSSARIFVIQDGVTELGRVSDLREMRDEAKFEIKNMNGNRHG
jgi:putative SbcD/Mre11-related phosphoesterase